MEYYERLRNLIEDNDINQTQLAMNIGVDRKQIQRWIKGETEMGITKLRKICEYFEVSADYILGLAPDLDWPRGKGERKHAADRTKYTFLYNTLPGICLRSRSRPSPWQLVC